MKEEQEDVCISQEGEQFGLKQETQTFDEDAPQLHDCKEEEEVLTVQQLCDQERNSSLDQEEQDGARVKEEEELCSSQEEEDFGLKQETDTFMVSPADEDNDRSETESSSEQLPSHNSPDTESQDQGAGKTLNPGSSKHEEPQPTNRLHRKRSDQNNVDNSSMSENQCDTDKAEKSVKCSVNVKDSKRKRSNTIADLASVMAQSHADEMWVHERMLEEEIWVHDRMFDQEERLHEQRE
ncbi:uncharacterized protein KZ484_016960 [Pholidichthys leucotaenia]